MTTVPPPVATTVQQPVVTVPPARTTASLSFNDQILIDSIDHPDVASLPSARKIELARSACADFDNGIDAESIRTRLMGAGFPRSAATQIMQSAVAAYCSDYLAEAFGYTEYN